MTRIAFTRSIELSQTRPWLAELVTKGCQNGDEFALFYTDGPVSEVDFPGEKFEIDPSTSPGELVGRILEWGPDLVVSLSIPDENAIRDSVAAAMLRGHGIPAVMHPIDMTVMLSDKARTKTLLESARVPVPPSFSVDGDLLNGRAQAVPGYQDAIVHRAESLGYPLIVKPLWACLGQGMTVLRDAGDLAAWLEEPHDGNVLIEKFIVGELVSVEMVGDQTSVMIQPPLWMGTTGDGPVFTFERVRYAAPRCDADKQLRTVTWQVAHLVQRIGIAGAVDLDLVWDGEQAWVLEINPRVSGATTLSVAASSQNTYEALVSIGRSEWDGPGKWHAERTAIAAQIPLLRGADHLLAETMTLVRTATYHVEGRELPNVVVKIDPDRLPAASAAFTRALSEGVISVDVHRQIQRMAMSIGPTEQSLRVAI
ncbi:MAG: ATP-grasp domain-containing protein [Nocardioides sp.]|uniref:ATP-grasp domain-containing protein n=1 Tax=Nocardioides sp. TaxID=35761 RepID=UPI003D6A65EF